MTEEPTTEFMKLAETYGAKNPKKRGTPCRCKNCGYITKIRLKKGISLKKIYCFGCCQIGVFERFTKYDQEQKAKKR
jgi:hypothetical protein